MLLLLFAALVLASRPGFSSPTPCACRRSRSWPTTSRPSSRASTTGTACRSPSTPSRSASWAEARHVAAAGAGHRGHRGFRVLPSRRRRSEGHFARGAEEHRRAQEGAGRVDAHPAARQAGLSHAGEELPAARSTRCSSQCRSRRISPRTRSSSCTPIRSTSDTARTASKRPRGSSSASTPRS